MDFFQIRERSPKRDVTEVYPDFKVCRSKDLMVRGKSFYAIWDEERGMWSTDEYDVQRLVDKELFEYRDKKSNFEGSMIVRSMASFSSKSWVEFRKYLCNISDSNHQLDESLTFSNTEIKKKDYVSKRLPYPLEAGPCDAYEELISTLYDEDERAKLEWAIGSIVAGEGKDIQKFIVLYGDAGSGKSTVLNIIQKLFEGYYTTFEAKALTSSSNVFSTEVFKSNPLVAIQHDGDLSKIEDNTKLNSIISHEEMTMNEKFKPSYTARTNCFLFMATNRPVKITDAKSGIIRRLIDVHPSGRKIPNKRYHALMSQIEFELGAIASHCLDVYREMGKNYYSSYRPIDMMFKTDVFFNFVESYFEEFKSNDGVTLGRAYDMYKTYCDEALVDFKLPRHKFREELKNYFKEFNDVTRVDGKLTRSYYSRFSDEKFTVIQEPKKEKRQSILQLDCTDSIFDKECSECKAQYASTKETPTTEWAKVTTKLKDLDTTKLHYVQVPENHIVIDFDLKDSEGNKSEEKNLEAASKWPQTYMEYSKGGSGIHLHYIYDGDVEKLNRIFSEGIEIKVPIGGSSIRRKVTKCNRVPIATINAGLPLKGEKMINISTVRSEKGLRDLIARNLRKEIHGATKPSIDFIHKILDDAYNNGIKYDVSDLRPRILAFANNSSHQSDYCIRTVSQMKFKSEEASDSPKYKEEDALVFFDVEVFPNLFLVTWKMEGPKSSCVRMINPSPQDIEGLFKFKLVGFNCRRYDNHILYGRYLGYNNEDLYKLSKRIINGSSNGLMSEAFNISYTDVYDFSSEKQSLKKFEIDLGIHHQELGFPWDEPVPEDKWGLVAEYCDNDVIATEAVFNARKSDWIARKILAEVAGMTVNDTTNSLTTRIIFGKDKHPQSQFNYRNMGEILDPSELYNPSQYPDIEYTLFDNGKPIFPGYKFENGVSTYRGEKVGEGGYVYAEPGMHFDVSTLDIASMHPSSIVAENLFGPYTQRFKDILDARIAIKHKDFDSARKMLDGKLSKYLEDESAISGLADALKIAINSVYGLTSAGFDNPFRDPRNKDNIVAKRGALFMINLKNEVQLRGYTVAHIKTDSIKIPKATKNIIEFVQEYGRMYGYNFEHECTYDRICLVNDAVYIAKYDGYGIVTKGGKNAGKWTATGAQFAHPYVFKALFTKDPIEFSDLCEAKSVTTALYLDMNERLSDSSDHDYHFVGKAGQFCPIKSGCNGGKLVREKEGKFTYVSGSKDYRWLESEVVKLLKKESDIDMEYFSQLANKAIENISKYGDFEMFVSDDHQETKKDHPPWELPCGKMNPDPDCVECANYTGVDCGFPKIPF